MTTEAADRRSRFAFRSALYPIVGDTEARSAIDLADQLIGVGLPLLQLRLKEHSTREIVDVAREIRKRTRDAGVDFIVNDRVDVAALVEADGVHLGQHDLPPVEARKIFGPRAIIGFSTHDHQQLAEALGDPSLDYVAYGPIFATASKVNPDPVRGVDDLRSAARDCTLPLVAIGGIDASNIAAVVGAGADAAAVIGAIANADSPAEAAAELLAALSR
jgi:thiamine-phosphate pyrophosphorylase